VYASDFEKQYAQNVGGQFKDPYQNYLMTKGAQSDIPMLLEQYKSAGHTDTPQWASLAGTNFNDLPQMTQTWDASGANPVDYMHAWNSTTPTTNSAPQDYWANLNAYNTGKSQWNPQTAIANNTYDPARFAAYNSGLPIEGSHDAWPSYVDFAKGGVAGIPSYSLGGYSDGGRMLKGPGDGMSDDIPASIGGKQPARLADGEFVVPADVVSHLGNGSTDAGAKRLYAMMDSVRQARTGTKKQGKQIKADKYLPA
jgi:hypothetical protein